MENAVLLYGSATPSVETYYRAKTGEIELLEMTKRANNMLLPEVKVVDMRNELNAGNRSVFSRCLQNEIRKILTADSKQSFSSTEEAMRRLYFAETVAMF